MLNVGINSGAGPSPHLTLSCGFSQTVVGFPGESLLQFSDDGPGAKSTFSEHFEGTCLNLELPRRDRHPTLLPLSVSSFIWEHNTYI